MQQPSEEGAVHSADMLAYEWPMPKLTNDNASLNGGLRLYTGAGTAVDYNTAAQMFSRLSQAGDSRGKYCYGVCLISGRGVQQDVQGALKAWRESQSDLAFFALGKCYFEGWNVPCSVKEAFTLFQLAAQFDNALALYYVGCAYFCGVGVVRDYNQALQHYVCAAEKGFAQALNCVGVCYHCGYGVDRDVAQAAQFYRRAAENGIVQGQLNYGYCLETGLGVERNPELAAQFYRTAALRGSYPALVRLGKLYETGVGVPCDENTALRMYTLAAERGNMLGNFQAGKFILSSYQREREATDQCVDAPVSQQERLDGNQLVEQISTQKTDSIVENHTESQESRESRLKLAIGYLEAAAAQNHAGALNNLGACYGQGIGVARSDEYAMELYTRAAARGSVVAEFNVACALMQKNTKKADAEAVQRLQRAADREYAPALLNLGYMTENGRGTEVDCIRAFNAFLRAAQLGNRTAMLQVARMLETGTGTPRDEKAAAEWYAKATE